MNLPFAFDYAFSRSSGTYDSKVAYPSRSVVIVFKVGLCPVLKAGAQFPPAGSPNNQRTNNDRVCHRSRYPVSPLSRLKAPRHVGLVHHVIKRLLVPHGVHWPEEAFMAVGD
jgi:hypothetical protein